MNRFVLLSALLTSLLLSSAHAEPFVLSSKDIKAGDMLTIEQVYAGFGCSGKNISPQLSWQGAPANTKSFALTVYDPDAPTGSGWWHWVIFNIDASLHELPKDAGRINSGKAPKGSIQSRTDFGSNGFGGACPPVGDKPHRYQFTLHALDVESLSLDADTPAAMVGFMLNQHRLAIAQFEALYQR